MAIEYLTIINGSVRGIIERTRQALSKEDDYEAIVDKLKVSKEEIGLLIAQTGHKVFQK